MFGPLGMTGWMKGWRRRPAAPIVAGLCATVLVASLGPGVWIPGLGSLFRLPESAAVDYADLPSGIFAPLRDAYVESILGRPLASPARSRAIARREAFGAKPSSTLERVTVTHDPTNDDISRAYVVPSVPFTARTDTSRATREDSGPTACSRSGSVWYRYVPRTDLALVANTLGTRYALDLGVFRRSSSGSFVMLGCDSDLAGNAQVAFRADSGVAYYFQVASTVSGGDLVFNLELQGITTRASVSSSGAGGNHLSFGPSLSADGRFVTFMSAATNLGGRWKQLPTCPPTDVGENSLGVSGCLLQVYLRDRMTHTTNLISAGWQGESGDAQSFTGTVSDDGRYVTYASLASNLVPDDKNQCLVISLSPNNEVKYSCVDIFVRDRIKGSNTRVSVSSRGIEADGDSFRPVMSGDARYVAFESSATNLVDDDTNGVRDVFVHDRRIKRTVRVSVSSRADQAAPVPASSRYPHDIGSSSIGTSRSGRYIMFRSGAPNLVEGDGNRAIDAFVHDILESTTIRVSVPDRSCPDDEANGDTLHALGAQWTISDDGRFALFNSTATNLVCAEDADTNHTEDLFLRDLVAGTTTRLFVDQRGTPGLDPDWALVDAYFTAGGQAATELNYSITPDGKYVVFSSGSPELSRDDANAYRDIFLHDRRGGSTTLLSVSTAGVPGNDASNQPNISADGRFVAFQSDASNLAGPDENRVWDVYVRELPGHGPPSNWK